MTENGLLKRKQNGRWEINGTELQSGHAVEIQIDDHWICGVIEHWQDGYYWFSRQNGTPVILHSGIKARLPMTKDWRK